tara:strand:+ start:88 stop:477 length:390 start_codon:yes stop_codon:yes gene_type:complete
MEKTRLVIKPEVDIFDLLNVDPVILEMIAFTYEYCTQYNLPCTITSLMEHVDGRKTSTHYDGRAVDFSSRGFTDFHIARFQHEFRKKFIDKGAFNKAGESRPIVYHKRKGGVAHFHMQCRRRNSDGTMS